MQKQILQHIFAHVASGGILDAAGEELTEEEKTYYYQVIRGCEEGNGEKGSLRDVG